MHGLLSGHAPKRKLLQTQPHLLIRLLTLALLKEIRARRLSELRTRPPTARQQRRDPGMHIPGL